MRVPTRSKVVRGRVLVYLVVPVHTNCRQYTCIDKHVIYIYKGSACVGVTRASDREIYLCHLFIYLAPL